MSRGKYLSDTELNWAWNKWNEGYRQKDIARALGCNVATINRKFCVLQNDGNEKQYIPKAVSACLPDLIYSEV